MGVDFKKEKVRGGEEKTICLTLKWDKNSKVQIV